MSQNVDNYLALIPSQHQGKPNFTAVLTAILQPFAQLQGVYAALPGQFDLDNAVGDQLDGVGVRIGVSRKLAVPITGVYFSLDIEGLGLDQGILQGPFDPSSGLTSLDDETYRQLLKIKAMANSWDGSLEQAQLILGALSNGGTHIFMQDLFDMRILIGVSGVVPSALFAAMVKQLGEWVRPETVELAFVFVTSVNGAPIFGLDVENEYIAGLDVGAWAMPA